MIYNSGNANGGSMQETVNSIVETLSIPPLFTDATNVTLPATTTVNVCEMTIPAKSKYLLIGRTATGIVTEMKSGSGMKLLSGTANHFQAFSINAVDANSGAHLPCLAYIDTDTECQVSIQKHNYTQSAISTGSGAILAIPLHYME